jgi:hypothetical protein
MLSVTLSFFVTYFLGLKSGVCVRRWGVQACKITGKAKGGRRLRAKGRKVFFSRCFFLLSVLFAPSQFAQMPPPRGRPLSSSQGALSFFPSHTRNEVTPSSFYALRPLAETRKIAHTAGEGGSFFLTLSMFQWVFPVSVCQNHGVFASVSVVVKQMAESGKYTRPSIVPPCYQFPHHRSSQHDKDMRKEGTRG